MKRATTPFETAIIDALKDAYAREQRYLTAYEIAWAIAWTKRHQKALSLHQQALRSRLVVHQACMRLIDAGLVGEIPGKDQWDTRRFFASRRRRG